MYKYIFSGSVGIGHRDGGDLIRDYEDIQMVYESRRHLDINDGPDLALAIMCIKDAYVSKLINMNLSQLLTDKTYVDVISAGLHLYEPKSFEITKETTERGLTFLQFRDDHNYQCSLQKSSAPGEPKIWFGITHPHPVLCIKETEWVPYPLPQSVDVPTRMHLNQHQVVKLLPYLERFAATGELL